MINEIIAILLGALFVLALFYRIFGALHFAKNRIKRGFKYYGLYLKSLDWNDDYEEQFYGRRLEWNPKFNLDGRIRTYGKAKCLDSLGKKHVIYIKLESEMGFLFRIQYNPSPKKIYAASYRTGQTATQQ